MKKLLLTYPNQRWQKFDVNTVWNLNPMTLCLLAAMVSDLVDVRVVDSQFRNLSKEQFQKELVDYHPDMVGISVLSSEFGQTLDITAALVKEYDKNCIVIAGGVHPTIEYINVVKNENIDFIVRGEGEYVLKALINYILGNGKLPESGLVFKKGGETIIQDQVFIDDISVLPWPDYSLISLNDYINVGPRLGPLRPPEYPYMRISVTRGCPFGCSFCQVETISGRKVRARDPEDVVNELIYYRDKYGIKSIQFDDDNIIANRPFFKKLLTVMIEKKLNLKFIIGAFAIFLLTDDILDLMIKAGCQGINVAIESGSKRVIKEIVFKPVDLDRVPMIIKKVIDRGLFVIANFIIGYPGESWDEIRETIRYAENCGADYVKLFIAVPLKNTKLWDQAEALNAFDRDMSEVNVEWRYSQVKSDEWTSKDISILRAYEWDRINFSPERINKVAKLWGVSPEELKKISKQTRDSISL